MRRLAFGALLALAATLSCHMAAAAPLVVRLGPPPLDPTTKTYLAKGIANGAPVPATLDQRNLDKLVRALKTNSILAALDGLYLLAVADKHLAQVNLAKPGSFTLSEQSAPAFLAYRGYKGDGAAAYLDTGFNPTTATSPHFVQNSATIGVVSLTIGTGTAFEIGAARSRLRTQVSGPDMGCAMNASSTTALSIADGWGDFACVRTASNAWKGYRQGVQAGATQSTASAALTNGDLTILSDGLSFSARRLAVAFFGAQLSDAQVLALHTALAAYLAAYGVTFPWAGDPIYISTASANGIPAGNDTTGNGTRAAPYLTLEKALSAMAPGGQVFCNDGTYSHASTFYSFATPGFIDSVTPDHCILQRHSGEDRVGSVAIATAGALLQFGRVVIDSAGDAANGLTIANETSPFTLALRGTTLLNAAKYGIAGGNAQQLDLVSSGTQCRLAAGYACFSFGTWAGGSFTSTGDTAVVTLAVSGVGAYLDADAVASGPAVSVTGLAATVTAANTADSYSQVIHLIGVHGATIAGGSMTITETTQGNCLAIHVYDDAVNGTDASNLTVSGVTINQFCAGGGSGITVGYDGDPGAGARAKANDATLTGNIIQGNAASQAGQLHCIELGYQDGGIVTGNRCDMGRYLAVSKGMNMDGGGAPLWAANIGTNMATKCLYQKGGSGTRFIANDCYGTTGSGQVCIAGDDDEGGNHALLMVFEDNLCDMENGGQMVTLQAGATLATVHTNDYWSATALPSAAFVDAAGTDYATAALWAAAHEADALGRAPSFVAAGSDFRLQAGSALKGAGTTVAGVASDFGGNAYKVPPSVGAWQ